MKSYLIKGALLVNEGKTYMADVRIKDGRIDKIDVDADLNLQDGEELIEAEGLYLLPGAIDDQVHFREPGLTHKGDIYTDSRAAVAGGVTSYMEMPNTIPNTLTQELLEDKFQLAAHKSLANYSFYMGASNTNLDEVLKTDENKVCGVKVFMGSSTGNMLVNKEEALENLFSQVPMLIATHCEDEETIRYSTQVIKEQYGAKATAEVHSQVRSAAACYLSSSHAIKLAKKHNTRLHVLHISTADEVKLFDNVSPLAEKRITAEVCVHHLWFSQSDYAKLNNNIKWNPSIKSAADREALWKGLKENYLDVIASDHSPHTHQEKAQAYWDAPSGGNLIQHSYLAILEKSRQGFITIQNAVQKMCHNPAIIFQIPERGFIREGYWADLVLIRLHNPWMVAKDSLLYKSKWSPFEGQIMHRKIEHTFVNGHLAFSQGKFDDSQLGKRLEFKRN